MSVVPVGCARPGSGVGGFGAGSFCSDVSVGPRSGEGKPKYHLSARLLSALMLLCGKCGPHQRQMKGSLSFHICKSYRLHQRKKKKQSGKWMNTLKKKRVKTEADCAVCIIFQ